MEEAVGETEAGLADCGGAADMVKALRASSLAAQCGTKGRRSKARGVTTSIQPMILIQERNRQILQMRTEGVPRREVALQFKLSTGRILQLEKRDAADKAMAERRGNLQEAIRSADDLGKMWLVNDVADAIGLVAGTKNRLLDHFVEAGKGRISLRELMDMCLDGPMDRWGFKTPPLWRVNGIGRKGFWSVVNGLTNMDLGNRCNEEWCSAARKWLK
jgi:hypothetical protein